MEDRSAWIIRKKYFFSFLEYLLLQTQPLLLLSSSISVPAAPSLPLHSSAAVVLGHLDGGLVSLGGLRALERRCFEAQREEGRPEQGPRRERRGAQSCVEPTARRLAAERAARSHCAERTHKRGLGGATFGK